jgi:hypothetical protein
VIKPVDFCNGVTKRSPHDIPHDHLHAFAACFADEIRMREFCVCERVAYQIVQKLLVKIGIDDTCALAAQLM